MAAVGPGRPVFLLEDVDSSKIVGAAAALVDNVFALQGVDFVLAEADGAAGRLQRRRRNTSRSFRQPRRWSWLSWACVRLAAASRMLPPAATGAALLGCDIDHVLEPPT